MPNLRSRLTALERQRPPGVMLGSLEMHRLEGSPDSAGEACEEHQGCLVEKTPTSGSVRRIYDLREIGELA